MRIGLRVSGARLVFSLAIVAMLAGTGPVLAATRTWTGAGGDANWSTAGNWVGGIAPVAGDDLVFPGGAAQLSNNNDFAAGTSFNSISFTLATGGYSLNGNSIQLVAGISAANTANDNRVYVAIQLTAPQTFACTITSPNRLYIEGAVNLGANTLTLSLGASGVIQVDGVITGTGGVTITGTGGVAVISGTDTYSGPTNVQGGTLLALNLSGAGPVTVGNSALIQFANDAAVGVVTVNSGGTAMFEGGGTNQIGHATNFTAQSGSRLEFGMYGAANYGQLVASGAVTLNNPVLTLAWIFTSATGNTFTIINKTSPGAITGTFNGLAEGATFTGNGRTYRITYVGGDGNDAVVTDITGQPLAGEPIPTASGLGLAIFAVLLAAGGLFVLRRYSA